MAKNSPITSRAARREGIIKDRPGYQGKAGTGKYSKPPHRKGKRGR